MMEWGKLRHGVGKGRIQPPACSPGSVPTSRAAKHPASAGPGCRRARTDLVLAAPAGVVEVVVAPVVMGPVLRLLIQPVELVGAALHVVLQGVQILLPLLGTGLGRVRGENSAQSSSPRVPWGCLATPVRDPCKRALPPGSQSSLTSSFWYLAWKSLVYSW